MDKNRLRPSPLPFDPIPDFAELESSVGWNFFVAGGHWVVSSPGVQLRACGWRRPWEAEHELTLGEWSPCSRRARAGCGGRARGGRDELGGRARDLQGAGSGLQAGAPWLGPAGWLEGAWVGRGCRPARGWGRRGALLQQALPTARAAEHGDGGPTGRLPAVLPAGSSAVSRATG